MAHPPVYGASPWISLLSLYWLDLEFLPAWSQKPVLGGHPEDSLWDVSILSPTPSLSWYTLMPLPQPCLWLRRRWSLFMTIWPRREKSKAWASLVVQGLRLYASTAGSAGLTPWSQKFHMPLDVGKKKLDLLIGQSGVWVQAEKEPQLHYSPTLGWSWKMVPREIVPVNNSSHTWCKQKCRQGWNIYGLKALIHGK